MNFFLTIIGCFLITSSFAMELLESCENLAWKIVQNHGQDIEDYGDIVDVMRNLTKNEYKALVRPNETSWYGVTLKYDEYMDNCILLNVEVSHR